MAHAERILEDLHQLAGEIESVLAQFTGKASDQVEASVGEVQSRLGALRERMSKAEDALGHAARRAAHVTDRSIRRNPWQTIAVVAAAAFIAGLMLGSHQSSDEQPPLDDEEG